MVQAAAPQQSPVANEVHQVQASNQAHAVPYSQSGYYSPAGVVTVVGASEQQQQQQASAKPSQQTVRNFEQYGQPESAALPPNYKPFGSWGLYIGGNPADGYYTNYYKALSASVNENKEKVSPSVLKASALASGGEQAYYPYAYSQGDFATVHNQHPVIQPVSSQYGAPQYDVQGYDQHGADVYSTRKGSAQVAAVPVPVHVVQKEVLSKGENKAYSQPQSRVYVYSPPVASHVVSPIVTRAQVQEQQQQQVVAYPVPVGSQIVGSQAGVDGSFYPYGVHAYTRYVVKPTLVGGQEPQHSVPQQPAPADAVYQQSQGVVYQTSQQQPQQFGNRVFYQPYYTQGAYYPVNPSQLHYSKVLQHYSPEFKPVEDYPFNVVNKPVSSVENKPVEEVRSPFNEAASNERRA